MKSRSVHNDGGLQVTLKCQVFLNADKGMALPNIIELARDVQTLIEKGMQEVADDFLPSVKYIRIEIA